MSTNQLTVGELAERTGTTRRAVRLYEQIGLIESRRGANGYRLYSEDDVEEVLFIKALRSIGASLKELTELYQIKRSALSETEKHRRLVAMIDHAVERLNAQRAAIDAALAQLAAYRQDITEKMA